VHRRPDKLEVTRQLLARLRTRCDAGPAEPPLDGYITELASLEEDLATHVSGGSLANAARASRMTRLERADIEVDTWMRHVVSFIEVQAGRHDGAHVSLAWGLHAAVCPHGLAHVDDRIVVENAHCRHMLSALRSPEHAPAVAALELPPAWLTKFEAALNESDAALEAVTSARDEKIAHIGAGRDVELEWTDTMVRLRNYVSSRARQTETAKVAEGRALLKPLLDAMKKLDADAAARATRRAKQNPDPSPAPVS
jgi:hypothetical protein